MSQANFFVNLIHKTATSGKKPRMIFSAVGLPLFITLMVLFVLAALWVDGLLGFSQEKITGRNVVFCIPIIGIGLLLTLWSCYHFFRVKGTPVPLNPPPKVVNSGPYAYVRNPMITGLFIVLFGLGVLFRSVCLTFIFTPLIIILARWELKAVEEPELERRLGDEYREYKKRVPMFFPRFRGGEGGE